MVAEHSATLVQRDLAARLLAMQTLEARQQLQVSKKSIYIY